MGFIKRNILWVAMALIVPLGGVAFGFLFMPAAKENNEELSALQSKAQNVSKLVKKADLKNPEWITQAEKLEKQYEEDLDAVMERIRERGDQLHEVFTDPEDPESDQRPEAGAWKDIYYGKMDELAERIEDSFAISPAAPLMREEYGPTWPTEAEMARAEKEYWIQEAIYSVLMSVNSDEKILPYLTNFDLTGRPERLMHPSHGTMFEPVAFEVEMSLEFQYLPMVLARLARDEAGIYVTSLSITRGLPEDMMGRRRGRRASGGARRTGGAQAAPEEEEPDEVEGMVFMGMMPGQSPMSMMSGGAMAVPATPRGRGAARGAAREEEEEPEQKGPVKTLVDVVLKGYLTYPSRQKAD